VEHSPAFLRLVDAAKASVRQTDVPTIHARLERGERFHLVDVREDLEWAAGHIPGALHLGRGVIERDIERVIPDSDAEIVLYCGGGYRSALVAESLQKMGYANVASMDGGWRVWREAGLDTAGAE
jgi:rhodanese-related sulfurtransferase